MLKINISALGTEHFAVFYPEKEFNEDEFMEEHSEDYMELADDNIDMEISSFNMECIINVNGTDIQIDDDFIEKSSVIQGKEPSLREFVGANESDVAICWTHGASIEYEFSWNNVNDFDSSKVKIHFFEEGEDVFNFITYDDKDADDMDLVSIGPKGGFDGPEVLFPGDESRVEDVTEEDSNTISEEIKDGINTQYYENGQKKSEGNYKDGKEEGLHTSWHENGQKESEGDFKDGKEDGLFTQWWENGQKESEFTYIDGMMNGKVPEWDENGWKWNETYYINDEIDKSFMWHKNGQKRCEEYYKDGEMDGEWIEWYENGQKESEGKYKNDKKDGLHITWHENGQKESETNWNNGTRGKSTQWNEDGDKI